jgi:hypothetical protein
LSDTEALSASYAEEITRKKIQSFGRQQGADRQEQRDDWRIRETEPARLWIQHHYTAGRSLPSFYH